MMRVRAAIGVMVLLVSGCSSKGEPVTDVFLDNVVLRAVVEGSIVEPADGPSDWAVSVSEVLWQAPPLTNTLGEVVTVPSIASGDTLSVYTDAMVIRGASYVFAIAFTHDGLPGSWVAHATYHAGTMERLAGLGPSLDSLLIGQEHGANSRRTALAELASEAEVYQEAVGKGEDIEPGPRVMAAWADRGFSP